LSCTTTGTQLNKQVQNNRSEIDIPHMIIQGAAAGSIVNTPCNGTLLITEQDEPWGVRAIILTKEKYYFTGEEREVEYELVIGSLRNVTAEPGFIEQGSPLGLAAENVYISARLGYLDPFMIRSSDQIPKQKQNMWWFSPEWLIPGNTLWLSFRQVESFTDAIEDFVYRWEREENEPSECTVHFFPEFDRIRVFFPIASYPQAITKQTPCLTLAENVLYSYPGIHTHQTIVRIGNRDLALCWQKDFDKYLRKEYSTGEELWLYLSIVALDHLQKNILVFVRDFAMNPDEEVIKERLKIIEKETDLNPI